MKTTARRQISGFSVCLLVNLSLAAGFGQPAPAEAQAPRTVPGQPVRAIAAPSGSYEVIGNGQRRYADPKSQKQHEAWQAQESEKRAALHSASTQVVTVNRSTETSAAETVDAAAEPVDAPVRRSSAPRVSAESIEMEVSGSSHRKAAPSRADAVESSITLEFN